MTHYITIPLSKKGKHAGKYEAIIDECDYDLAGFNWSVTIQSDKLQYAGRTIVVDGKCQNTKLHRVIAERMLERELLPTEQVDHISGDGLDCRRKNLRVVTSTQNQANQRKRTDNTSGFKGVVWSKSIGKWLARIQFNYKLIKIGCFDTPEEAHEAYLKKAKELFGEFARGE